MDKNKKVSIEEALKFMLNVLEDYTPEEIEASSNEVQTTSQRAFEDGVFLSDREGNIIIFNRKEDDEEFLYYVKYNVTTKGITILHHAPDTGMGTYGDFDYASGEQIRFLKAELAKNNYRWNDNINKVFRINDYQRYSDGILVKTLDGKYFLVLKKVGQKLETYLQYNIEQKYLLWDMEYHPISYFGEFKEASSAERLSFFEALLDIKVYWDFDKKKLIDVHFKKGEVLSNGSVLVMFHSIKYNGAVITYGGYIGGATNVYSAPDTGYGYINEYERATEEDTKTLLDAFAKLGYIWDAEEEALVHLSDKPKVGDIVIAWDDVTKEYAVIGVLSGIKVSAPFPYTVGGVFFQHIVPFKSTEQYLKFIGNAKKEA